ncbi:MAG: exo-alpha-sialidase [Acidobacteriales bacterium]|nr:exo-alpha-sialidase [Terriglobales bacterium]
MHGIHSQSSRAIKRFHQAALLVISITALLTIGAQAQVQLIKLSTDTFTNTNSQHMTEVEPDTYAFGNTIVSAFQVGRIFDGGSSDIGFATSNDGGLTWTNGFLPGLTTFFEGGKYSAASDPAVAYDPVHGVWMICTLGLASQNVVLVSTSTDGINWNNPITVNSNTSFADKNWIVCDDFASSPFYGNCYVEWDDAFGGEQMKMSRSTDGGKTWSAAVNVRNAFGLGGQPVVQPNGTVVVAYEGSGIQAYTSTDGGLTWNSPVTIASINDHFVAGNLRTQPLPSAEVDGAGTVYVAWQDCRYRTSCTANDIVISTSTDGVSWSAVHRVPLDPLTSTRDHFIPGLAVDKSTSGATARLALTYYFYQVANCSTSTCKLGVGYTTSSNGGRTWTTSLVLAGPMQLSWLPTTTLGPMVGDYISSSFVNGHIAYGVFAKALAPVGSVFNEAMYTKKSGLTLEDFAGGAYLSSAADRPIPGAHSDHGPRPYLDDEGRVPRPPERD